MRAQVNFDYGDVSVLRPAILPRPVPGDGELLIKTLFAGVNHVDWQLREGWFKGPGETRFPFVPGWDVCGIVVEKAFGFRTGDRVFSYCRSEANLTADGAYAEYVKVRADSCARAPLGVASEQLAVLPLVCLTALQTIMVVPTHRSDSVLLLGANGAVGRQVLAGLVRKGLAVTVAARPEHHESLMAAGAIQAVDQRSPEDLFEVGRANIVVDCGVGLDITAAARLLTPGGRFVSIVKPPDLDQARQAGIFAAHVFCKPVGSQLESIATLITERQIPLPDVEVVSLDEAAAAQERVKAGDRRRFCLRLPE